MQRTPNGHKSSYPRTPSESFHNRLPQPNSKRLILSNHTVMPLGLSIQAKARSSAHPLPVTTQES